MKKRLFTLLMFALLAASLFAVDKVPDFTLEDAEGKMVTLSELLKQNDLVVIDFWASWCVPCKNALPKLSKIDEDNKNVAVLAITIDKPKDQKKAKTIVKSSGYKFITLFDSNEEVKKMLNVKDVPRTFVVNKKMEIVYDHTGYTSGDEEHLKTQIEKNIPKK